MKTEAMGHATFHKLAQEDHILAHLLDGDMEVLHTGIYVLKVVQFVIMGGEQGLCPVAIFMDIFHYGPCNGHSVIGRCASPDLVQKHKRTRRKIVQDHGCLQHLHHEGRLSARNIVRCTYAGEYLVAIADCRCFGRNKAADLCHKHYESCLTQQCRFTGHVRTREDDHLLVPVVKIYVVRDEFLAGLHHGLDDRVTTLLYVYDLAVIHLRAAVVVGKSQIGKAGKHIQARQDAAVLLNHGYIRLNFTNKLRIYLSLKGIYPFLRSKDLLLVFLQLFGDIALGIDQSLLPYPFLRHSVLICITHFKIIAEDIVEAYLQRRYSCTLDLPLLHFEKIFLAVTGYLAKLVKLFVHTFRDHVSLAKLGCSLRMHGTSEIFQEFRTVPHAADKGLKRLDPLSLAELHYRSGLAQPSLELHHLTRHDLARSRT